MTLAPNVFDMPMGALSAAAIALCAAKTLKTLLLHPQKVGSGVLGTLAASTAGLALTYTVGKAVLAGIFTSRKPFLRTPKCEDPADFGQVLRLAWQETTLMSLLFLAIGTMIYDRGFDDPAATLWMTMLAIQSLPYVATVTTAGLSAFANARTKRARPVAATAAKAASDPVLPKAA